MESMEATWMVVAVASYMICVYSMGTTGPLTALAALRSKEVENQDQSKTAEIMVRIHNRRLKAWVAGTALSSVCAEGYCFFLLVQSQFHGGLQDFAYSLHFWTAFTSSAITRWASRPTGQTSPEQTMVVSTILNLLGVINSLDLSTHLMCANYLGRAFVGSFSPDIWFTVRLNFYLLPAFVACAYWRLGPERDSSILPALFINELISVVFISVILGQLNYLTIRQEQSTMELEENLKKEEIHTRETESILKAAKGLLAVMCDCCEQLSPEWEILKPSNKFLEMFRFPSSSEEKPTNFSLLELIALDDRDRFTHFIDTSEVEAVTSLHLRMHDFSGGSVDVQLFHVPVPNLSEEACTLRPRHLVGFNVKDIREPRLLRRDIPSIPEGEVLEDYSEECASVSSSEEASQSSQSSHRLKAQVENMSFASKDPAFLSHLLQHVHLLERVKLTLDLHTCQEGYAIREMTLSFHKEPAGASSSSSLYFYKFLKKRSRAEVEDFLQEHVNSFYYGVDCSERCAGVKMKIPNVGAIMVGEMTVQEIRLSEEQFHLELDMRNLVGRK
ncbi:Uncharacterized protein SCF082_LOCUS5041 [Durusdinium trenchii]|uniref:Mannosyltransferase n=1 Tax=Durusdinium trenchii TaxID=1381693 RepID=A0ABP0I651_9DINO